MCPPAHHIITLETVPFLKLIRHSCSIPHNDAEDAGRKYIQHKTIRLPYHDALPFPHSTLHPKYTTSSFFLSKMTFFDMLGSEVIKKAVF